MINYNNSFIVCLINIAAMIKISTSETGICQLPLPVPELTHFLVFAILRNLLKNCSKKRDQ